MDELEHEQTEKLKLKSELKHHKDAAAKRKAELLDSQKEQPATKPAAITYPPYMGVVAAAAAADRFHSHHPAYHEHRNHDHNNNIRLLWCWHSPPVLTNHKMKFWCRPKT